ncbi:12847_t:CDS:1, partial [Racocetra persica]
MLRKLLEAKDNGISEEKFLFGKSLPVETYFSDTPFNLNSFSIDNHYSKIYSFLNLSKHVESTD